MKGRASTVQGGRVAEALLARLEPVVRRGGYDLEDLVVTTAGRRRLVRVLVDKDGGVTLDECAEVSRDVSAVLDAADDLLGQQPYTLEVSSPGTSRPLTLPRHWRRNTGRLVAVTLTDGRSITGRVLASDDDAAQVRPEGADDDAEPVTVSFDDVAKSVVQVELTRSRHGEEG